MNSRQLSKNTCPKDDHGIAFLFSKNNFQSAVWSIRKKEKLIEVKTDSSLEVQFKKKSLIVFWADMKEEYPEILYKALIALLLFTSAVFVEKCFLSYMLIKNKYRNRLSVSSDLSQIKFYLLFVDPDLKIKSSQTTPRIALNCIII